MGSLYDRQGRYDEAEPLYDRCLAIRKEMLGPEHPEVALAPKGRPVAVVTELLDGGEEQ